MRYQPRELARESRDLTQSIRLLNTLSLSSSDESFFDRKPLFATAAFSFANALAAQGNTAPLEDAAIAIRGNEILILASRIELLFDPDAPRDAIVTKPWGWICHSRPD